MLCPCKLKLMFMSWHWEDLVHIWLYSSNWVVHQIQGCRWTATQCTVHVCIKWKSFCLCFQAPPQRHGTEANYSLIPKLLPCGYVLEKNKLMRAWSCWRKIVLDCLQGSYELHVHKFCHRELACLVIRGFGCVYCSTAKTVVPVYR